MCSYALGATLWLGVIGFMGTTFSALTNNVCILVLLNNGHLLTKATNIYSISP